ncbi:endonuclease/exonuclease/phosphatase family protein [Hoylesella nanceiensis]|mgnify:FL=1|jgi:endonuclease/exonuclease/phosphatase|uniref:endonuclease/exonuclease/phosphatase family protein n=1 Tax=Hoylesella nanceiensis TaxID=425941 RepID=UPI001CB2D50D|nr:endonuclease/exonuclease/phosphatase family protein [Hoylesella nanceiensis]MBF1439016.1 endonuclease/exonuclease/phosphatase family protein [Hoylesella nanceiensis]
MKHFFFAVIGVLLAFLPASAQKKYSVYGVGFYNQENLFDTCHDEGKRDYDFLPTGSYKWNAMKYNHKLNNMSRALADMGTDVLPNIGCAIIGLAEVENSKALDDLIAQPALSARNYQYVHIEGPDRRGIDCALLYNPSLFSVKNTRLVPYVQKLKKDSAFYTRGFLTVSGTLADENVAVIVCHLPSRFSESFYRELGAEQVKAIKDSLLNDDPNCKVFVMGDMNDDPIDKSMAGILKGKGNIKDVNEGDMYNPWYNILVKEGVGTLLYQGSWNLFDQILVTPNLLNKDDKKDFSSLKFWKNQIFKRDYLFQTEGKYKGSPKRTTAGGVWLDGYSDHLPVVVYLVKEQ